MGAGPAFSSSFPSTALTPLLGACSGLPGRRAESHRGRGRGGGALHEPLRPVVRDMRTEIVSVAR